MMRAFSIVPFVIAGGLLTAAPQTITLVSPSLLNGSFEAGAGNTTITNWTTGFGSGETQRLQNNASDGNWSLVMGQGGGESNLGASVKTNHLVAEGDTFDLSFRWLPKSNWVASDQVSWRLFTTENDNTDGAVLEIASGVVSGHANGEAYQTETLTGLGGTGPGNSGRALWLQFIRGSSATAHYARVDQVTLTVHTDPAPVFHPLDPSHLVAYYPFDGNAFDYSEARVPMDGTWQAGEAYGPGKIDESAAEFSGTGTLTIPNRLERDFTLSFWLKTTATAPAGPQWWQGQGLVDGRAAGDGLGISLNGSKIAFGAGNSDTTLFSTTTVNDGEWRQVTVQRHSFTGTLRLFIDGVLEAEATGAAGERDMPGPLVVGGLDGGGGFLTGSIDDLRIFDRLLDEESVLRLYSRAGDDDGDGHGDLEELVATSRWTDSHSVLDSPMVAGLEAGAGCDIAIRAVAGRSYLLQRSTTLDGDWEAVGEAANPIYHGRVTLTDPASPAAGAFYRVGITGRGRALEKAPNIVLIYADDVGYGDVGAYNANSLIPTPNIDQFASQGLRFTDAHCTASTCSPSRYSLLTGVFAFRGGPSVLSPTAGLSIPENTYTLPDMLKEAGYRTAVVGKWHLGIGAGGDAIDWNGTIAPGPLEIGFDTSFLLPTTNDRVPCVYLRDRHVVGLDPGDPLYVHNSSYAAVNIPGSTQYPYNDVAAQTYYTSSNGHNNSVINGIGRIGYMSGGQSALWDDETMARVFVDEAKDYIAAQDGETPFFLYFASQDIHVPRAPHPDFQGATTLGYRGDAMVQFDWSVGEILQAIDDAGLAEDTLVILSSDNGPVLDDGYNDGSSNDAAQGHDSSGPFSGGKYSILEGGTRVPFIVRWPRKVAPGVSDALVSQVDLMGSLAGLLQVDLPAGSARDSRDIMAALTGEDSVGLPFTVEQTNSATTLALRAGNLKYINDGRLYDVGRNPGETTDIATSRPTTVAEMAQQLEGIVQGNGVRE